MSVYIRGLEYLTILGAAFRAKCNMWRLKFLPLACDLTLLVPLLYLLLPTYIITL